MLFFFSFLRRILHIVFYFSYKIYVDPFRNTADNNISSIQQDISADLESIINRYFIAVDTALKKKSNIRSTNNFKINRQKTAYFNI
jgi:hypothetical protein